MVCRAGPTDMEDGVTDTGNVNRAKQLTVSRGKSSVVSVEGRGPHRRQARTEVSKKEPATPNVEQGVPVAVTSGFAHLRALSSYWKNRVFFIYVTVPKASKLYI